MVHSESDFDDISRASSPIYNSYTDGPLEDVKARLPQREEDDLGVENLKVSLADGVATLKGNAKDQQQVHSDMQSQPRRHQGDRPHLSWSENSHSTSLKGPFFLVCDALCLGRLYNRG